MSVNVACFLDLPSTTMPLLYSTRSLTLTLISGSASNRNFARVQPVMQILSLLMIPTTPASSSADLSLPVGSVVVVRKKTSFGSPNLALFLQSLVTVSKFLTVATRRVLCQHLCAMRRWGSVHAPLLSLMLKSHFCSLIHLRATLMLDGL